MESGGQSFDHIPCLNDFEAHIDYMVNRLRPLIDANVYADDAFSNRLYEKLELMPWCKPIPRP